MFGSNGATAPYPTTGYPMQAFLGAQTLNPLGLNASDAGPAGGAAGAIVPIVKGHFMLVLIVVVVGGYLLWHYNMK